MLCACCSGLPYSNCCEPFLSGRVNAPTALQLMRSRYTAFTLANVDYLMRTHDIKTRPVKDRENIERWARSVVWVGLTILGTEAGAASDNAGYVEFKAAFLENGKPGQIHERSFFHRENGKWFYVSGAHY